MNIKSIAKKVGVGFGVVLVLIQFIRIDKTNPVTGKELDFIQITQPSEEIAMLLKTSCYDCHSNETVYPWYANIAPASWWLKHHVDEGKEHLNFSEWGTYSTEKANHKLEECEEEIEEGEMPLSSYTLAHSEAKLSSEQRELLGSWIKSQIK